MTAHVSDELPRLLTGEASRDAVLDAAAHLRSCIDCQQELVLAVIAHASLTSAHRFAPEIVSDPTNRSEPSEQGPPEHALPDLTSMFAQVHKEAATTPTRLGSRRLRYGLAAAAAAAVVIGGATATVVANTSDSTPSGRQVALQAFDVGKSSATALVRSDGRMELDAASLPNLTARHYEVWLTNGKRTNMQPIGWLGPDGKATLTVPSSLMNRYSDIEVSVQDLGTSSYDYSGTSVLRGPYA